MAKGTKFRTCTGSGYIAMVSNIYIKYTGISELVSLLERNSNRPRCLFSLYIEASRMVHIIKTMVKMSKQFVHEAAYG